jgi:hypothetical protein
MVNKAVIRAGTLAAIAIISFWTRAAANGPNTSPASAIGPDNQSRLISAYTSLWYKFDYAGDRSKVEITLQNGAVNNLAFNLYAPDQITLPNDYGSPIGKGTTQFINCDGAKCLSNDLLWAGDFFVGGTFYIQVMNQNSGDKPFAISATGSGVAAHPYSAPASAPYYAFAPNYGYPNYAYPNPQSYTNYNYPNPQSYPNYINPNPQTYSGSYLQNQPAYPLTGYYSGQYAPNPPSGYSAGTLPPPVPIPYAYSPQTSSAYPLPMYPSGQYPISQPGSIMNDPTQIGGCYYSVVPGDTLAVIAARYRTDSYQIARVNGLANPNIIFVGQRLYVPNCQ